MILKNYAMFIIFVYSSKDPRQAAIEKLADMYYDILLKTYKEPVNENSIFFRRASKYDDNQVKVVDKLNFLKIILQRAVAGHDALASEIIRLVSLRLENEVKTRIRHQINIVPKHRHYFINDMIS